MCHAIPMFAKDTINNTLYNESRAKKTEIKNVCGQVIFVFLSVQHVNAIAYY